VMGLATGVVAEPPVPSALPAPRVSVGKSNHSSAAVTAGKPSARFHQPVHLQVHDPYEIVETPIRSDAGRVKLDSIIERKTDLRCAESIRSALRVFHGCL